MNITKKIHILLYLCLAIAGKVYGAAAPNYDEVSISDLISACATGNCDEVEKLLVNGISANTSDKNGKTALMYAAMKGDSSTMKLLLNHRADVNAVTQTGQTA